MSELAHPEGVKAWKRWLSEEVEDEELMAVLLEQVEEGLNDRKYLEKEMEVRAFACSWHTCAWGSVWGWEDRMPEGLEGESLRLGLQFLHRVNCNERGKALEVLEEIVDLRRKQA